MMVVSHSQGGFYWLAELTRSVSRLKFATFHIILYYPRSSTSIEVTQFIKLDALAGAEGQTD